MTLDYQPPGRSRSTLSVILCWMVIAGFVGIIFVSQARRARLAIAAAEKSATAPNLQLGIAGWASLAETQLLTKDQTPQGQASNQTARKQMLANIQSIAVSPLDKLKAVVMTRELLGTEDALHQLDDQTATFAPHPRLVADAAALREIYTLGPQSLTTDARDALAGDLGWFGRLAVTQGQPPNNPDRIAIVSSAQHSLLVMIGCGAAFLGAVFLGLLLLILMIVLFSLGRARVRFHPDPRPAKPVFLETFALWCLAYTAISFGLGRWKTGRSIVVPELIVLAGTILTALWPLLRGMSWAELRQSLGWHRGAGVFAEIGAGVFGFVAGLPVVGIGFCVTLSLIKLAHAAPTHPMEQEMTGSMPLGKIFTLLIAASVAAPILEETMFRGALYFHLRRRWRPWLSAGLVALIFAAIHPQGWTTIPVLGSIAVVLALLREWRGSLLASITAHGLSNGIVLLFGVLMLK